MFESSEIKITAIKEGGKISSHKCKNLLLKLKLIYSINVVALCVYVYVLMLWSVFIA